MATDQDSPRTALSFAFFGTKQREMLRDCLRLAKTHLGATGSLHIGPLPQTRSGRPAMIQGFRPQSLSAEALGFERVPISFARVETELAARLAATPPGTVLTVDMGWGLQTASATANFEGWMGIAAQRAQQMLVDQQAAIVERDDGAAIRWCSPPRGWCRTRIGCRRSSMRGARCANR